MLELYVFGGVDTVVFLDSIISRQGAKSAKFFLSYASRSENVNKSLLGVLGALAAKYF
jgi:hypothetical protein